MTKSDSYTHIDLLPEHWSHVVSQMVDNDDLNAVYAIEEIRPLICGNVWIRPATLRSEYSIDYSLRKPFDDDFDDVPISYMVPQVPKVTTLDFMSDLVMFEHVERIDAFEQDDIHLSSNTVMFRDIHSNGPTTIDKGKDFKMPTELKSYLKSYPIITIHISSFQIEKGEIAEFLGYIMHYLPDLFVRIAMDKVHSSFSIPEYMYDAFEKGSLIGFDLLNLESFDTIDLYHLEKWSKKFHDNYNYYLPQLEEVYQEFDNLNFSKIGHIKIDAPILKEISVFIGDRCLGGDLDVYFQNFHAPNVSQIRIKSYKDDDFPYHRPELNIPSLLKHFPKLKTLRIDARRIRLTSKCDGPCHSGLEELILIDNASSINFDPIYMKKLKVIQLENLEDLRDIKPILQRAQGSLEDISILGCGGLNSIQNLTFPRLQYFDFACHQIFNNNILTFANLELPEVIQMSIKIHVVGLILKDINAGKLKELQFDVQFGTGWSTNERFDKGIACPNLKELSHKVNTIDDVSELLVASSKSGLETLRCARRNISDNWFFGPEHVFKRNQSSKRSDLWIEEENDQGIPFNCAEEHGD